MYPVIFEPKNDILLSRFTYRVTSYIDYAPYINSFVKIHNSLKRFQADMDDPRHVGVMSLYNAQASSHIKRFVYPKAISPLSS